MSSRRVRNLKPLVSSEGLQPYSTSPKLDSDSITNGGSRKDGQPLKMERAIQEPALRLPKLHNSSDKSKIAKKRCRVCQQGHAKLRSLSNNACEDAVCFRVAGIGKGSLEIKDVKPANDDELQEQGRIITSCMVGSDACSSTSCGHAEHVKLACEDSHGQTDEKLVETAYSFSVEVASAIKQIESGILALLQLFEEKLDTTSSVREAFGSIGPKSVSPSLQANEEGVLLWGKVRYPGETRDRTQKFEQSPMYMAPESMSDRLHSQIQPRKASDIREKIWASIQDAASQKNQNVADLEGQYVHGLRVPPSPDEVTKKPPLSVAKSYRDSNIHDSLAQGKFGKRAKSRSRPSMPPYSMGSVVLNVRRNMATHPISNSMQSGKNSSNIRKARKSMSSNETADRRRVLPSDFEESDKMSRSNFSSSYMSTSQQQTFTSPSSSSGDGGYSLSLSSSKSSRMAESSSGSPTTGYVTSRTNSSGAWRSCQNSRASPLIRRDARRKTLRSNPDKRTGRLRRLKNKLGLIFHHHHHHHHHHHDAGSDDNDADAAKKISHQKKSIWKHLHQVFSHRGKNDFHEKQAVEKLNKRKSVVSKDQAGHFHSLVEGLMRHVQHSKKSKPWKAKKGGIQRRTRNVKHHGKDVRWWKMPQNRGGVKLPSKGRVKLGFGCNKKKPLLKQFQRLT